MSTFSWVVGILLPAVFTTWLITVTLWANWYAGLKLKYDNLLEHLEEACERSRMDLALLHESCEHQKWLVANANESRRITTDLVRPLAVHLGLIEGESEPDANASENQTK